MIKIEVLNLFLYNKGNRFRIRASIVNSLCLGNQERSAFDVGVSERRRSGQGVNIAKINNNIASLKQRKETGSSQKGIDTLILFVSIIKKGPLVM